MGKKVKVGKQRRDKFYHLAKEAGYRSRAAFKLIQLNKRFEFLQSSQALVDLCAAPGGWLQVASQNMPVSSIRIGVDLVSIKPIPNCITLQGDIREEKTRHLIIKELQNWEVDCVLNDGAPNVGLNWQHDAFQQNCLTLSALRLATRILRKNGYFVTKIFRSSDYLSLIGVFEKLFKKVHVWKPAASRLESAEIFVVCEKYVKPSKVDPDLLDAKKVFAEKVEEPKINPIRMLTARKKEKKKQADGYEEDDVTQFHVLKASEFVNGGDPLLMLSQASCIELDEEVYEKSPYLTPELRVCMTDIKVCGPAELRSILQWRKKILNDIKKEAKEKEKAEKPEETEEQREIRELEEIDELIYAAQSDEKAKIKKKKRQEFKEKQRLEERKKYEMVHKNDAPLVSEDLELFSLSAIRKQLKIQEYREQNKRLFNGKVVESGDESDEEKENENDGDAEEEADEEEKMQADDDDANPDGLLKQNLVRELPASESEKANKWFSKVNDLLSDEEEEENSLAIVEKQLNLQREKLTVDGKSATKRKANDEEKKEERNKAAVTKSEDKAKSKKSVSFDDSAANEKKKAFGDEDEIEIVPAENIFDRDEESSDDSETDNDEEEEGPSKKRPKYLTAEQLAMGEQMIHSAKKRKALEEAAFNRYTNNDEGLPDWFVADEKKHFKAALPVSQKRIEYYQERNRELNARPIKKVLEANARKQKRRLRRIERVKKRAESILENENMEHQEKIREMKRLYKKAGKPEKRNVQYQVMTKGKRGRGTRPNGPYRVVDKRLKKDKRGMDKANRAKNAKNNNKSGRKNKNSRGGGPRPKSAKSRS